MSTLPRSLEDSDDQEQDESSSEYYSPQLGSTPAFTMATETTPSTPDSFDLKTPSRRCKCGALISYDDATSSGILPSHDISTSGYHLELDGWLRDLTRAIEAACSRTFSATISTA